MAGAAIPLVRDLPPAAQARLAGRIRSFDVDPDAVLLQPGDTVSGIYFVAAGAVRVHYLDAEGNEGTLYRLEAGECCILAVNCLFAEMAYPAFAQAEGEGASLMLLDGAAARDLASSDTQFLRALFDSVAGRLYGLLATLERAIRLPLSARLARLLLDLADDKGVVGLSQERLAGHLGTSREVVTRILKGFVRDGLVRSGYGRIELVDRIELARLAL